MKTLKISLILSIICLQACAIRQLDRVPEIHCGEFEALNAGSVKTKTIQIEVKNLKKVNQQAGNSAQVAGKFTDILECVAEKGGFQIGTSTTHWTLTILDCDASTNPKEVDAESPAAKNPEKTSCVKMKTDFATPTFHYFGESSASQSYTFGDPNFALNGRIELAYRDALQTIIHKMNEKLQ